MGSAEVLCPVYYRCASLCAEANLQLGLFFNCVLLFALLSTARVKEK